jgi:phospholipase C
MCRRTGPRAARIGLAAFVSLAAISSCALEPLVPPGWDKHVIPPPDDVAAANRARCYYRAGALPAETQGESHPSGEKIPIDHFIVLMQENRSFDHYFQMLPRYGQPDAEVAPPDFANPASRGRSVQPFHLEHDCFVDTAHTWADVHRQIDGGRMDGFVVTSEGVADDAVPPGTPKELLDGRRAMGFYDGDDLPFYYWLASEFALADHYHASVPGPTIPNRMFGYAGTSFGATRNEVVRASLTIFDELDVRSIDYRIYADPTPGRQLYARELARREDVIVPRSRLIDDLRSGDLPAVVFVDPVLGHHGFDPLDEHPAAMAEVGQRWVAEVIDAFAQGPLWPSSVLFLTYDEHGGLFDHVPPPHACAPDRIAPRLEKGDPPGSDFTELGVRVPMIAVSPYAKQHFVGHHVYDHTSILRMIEARFVLPAMTARDANAEAPWELFDFDAAPHAEPPDVDIPTLDPARVEVCRAAFGY